MFDQINIETLILKYLQGELTEGEQRELDEWLKDDRNKKLFSRLINKQRILVKMERLDEYDWEESFMEGESFSGNIGELRHHC